MPKSNPTEKDIFQSFHPIVAEWFKGTFGRPSPPQMLGWPVISANQNALILAPTGSGKTLAAFFWSINDLFQRSLVDSPESFLQNRSGVHTLYISPLKALNNDIERNLNQPLSGIQDLAGKNEITAPPIRVLVRTGDTPAAVRNTIVRTPPHILITTPESLYLLLTSTRGRMIFDNLRYLIVDEIHAICSGKRGVHLSLSLERLGVLTRTDPVRIGLSATQRPLARIARYLGGWHFDPADRKFIERPVKILDCGQKKELDLKVLSPVPRFSDMGEASVWPAVYALLYELITNHRTTLIFTNMRAQTERLARKLNELHRQATGKEDAVLVMPHHGSMSREKRFEVEEQLKCGTIPAVIATASLELGIDIGSIDLVLHLEAPRGIASGIQRIGRSGHLIALKSKGRIIPLYPADLDDTATITQGMLKGDIEETFIPENCLDVLAQQIVAEVAMQSWPAEKLYRLICQSYCFRNLTRPLFYQVIEMLTGRYADTRLPALQPVITWDKTNEILIARRGARLQAILNGGTIPDRGYYTVMLSNENTRLGEMEEEFVFESKIGDIFYLGNSEWRIDDIRQDRIIVSPNKSVQPRAPFWKGEIPYRDYQTSIKIGHFRQWLINRLGEPDVVQNLINHWVLDRESAENLVVYFRHQQEFTGKFPTHKLLVAEWFFDTTGDLNFILHAPFGGRVLGLWAMALAGQLEKDLGSQIQYTCNNDAFLIRIRETTGDPPINRILSISPEKVENLLHAKISSTPVFAIMFRYNAGRALLLSRSRKGKRIPLWLQRLRSADLLQAVRQYPDFPVLLETYRSCLQDVFDLNSLRMVLDDVQAGKIKIHTVQTPYPSPLASGLLFNFVTNQMYEQDRLREPAQIAATSSDLLAQIMDKNIIPPIITPELVEESMERWQYRTHGSRPRDTEELYTMVERLGPLSRQDIITIAGDSAIADIDILTSTGRIVESDQGFVTDSRIDLYREPITEDNYLKRVQYYLESRGPERPADIASALHMTQKDIQRLLNILSARHQIVQGCLISGSEDIYYCDRNNFAQLYRRAVSVRRLSITAVDQDDYLKFLLRWHRFNDRSGTLPELLHQYRGLRLPLFFFEREVLPTRSPDSKHDAFGKIFSELQQILADGKYILFFEPDDSSHELYIKFIHRGEGWLTKYQGFGLLPDSEPEILNFLKENGASYLDDLEEGLQLPRTILLNKLKQLTRSGVISSENYDTVIAICHSEPAANGRAGVRKRVSDLLRTGRGRWFRLDTFGILGRQPSRSETAIWQARLLLNRYGILVKEFYRFEHGLLPWYDIFQALKSLEWQGEIRRGYFIRGLSGIQFAQPEALEILETVSEDQTERDPYNLINVLDPASPFGGNIAWPIESPQKILRLPGNHLGIVRGIPALYCERYFSRWYTFGHLDEVDFERLVRLTHERLRLPEPFRPRRKIDVETINGAPASESPHAGIFLKAGYETDGSHLVLWPSALY